MLPKVKISDFFTTFTDRIGLNKLTMSIFGIVLFLLIAGMAFWMLLFLMGFVLPFWITLGVFEKLRPKRIFEESEEH